MSFLDTNPQTLPAEAHQLFSEVPFYGWISRVLRLLTMHILGWITEKAFVRSSQGQTGDMCTGEGTA